MRGVRYVLCLFLEGRDFRFVRGLGAVEFIKMAEKRLGGYVLGFATVRD